MKGSEMTVLKTKKNQFTPNYKPFGEKLFNRMLDLACGGDIQRRIGIIPREMLDFLCLSSSGGIFDHSNSHPSRVKMTV